jgi:hypothetical protein
MWRENAAIVFSLLGICIALVAVIWPFGARVTYAAGTGYGRPTCVGGFTMSQSRPKTCRMLYGTSSGITAALSAVIR